MLSLVIDSNNFFLKFVLWVPPEHDLLKCRVLLWGLCAIACSKEWYEFISNDYCHRLGTFCWLTFYACAVETLTVIRFAREDNLFTEPFPWHIKYIWIAIGLILASLLSISIKNSLKKRAEEKEKNVQKFNPYNPKIEITQH